MLIEYTYVNTEVRTTREGSYKIEKTFRSIRASTCCSMTTGILTLGRVGRSGSVSDHFYESLRKIEKIMFSSICIFNVG